jgi:hypothetical protein
VNVRDIAYETARQFSEIAASQHWIEQRMVEIKSALNAQELHFNNVLKQLGIVIKEKKPRKVKTKIIRIKARRKQKARKQAK